MDTVPFASSRPAGRRVLALACAAASSLFLAAGAAHAQSSAQSSNTGTSNSTASGATSAANPAAIGAAQVQLYNAGGSNGARPDNNSFRGSVVTGKSTGQMLDLSLDEAVQRGLRQNLGLLLDQSSVQGANGQRLQQLQQLLPTITGSASIEVQQVNLAAYGLKFPGINPIIGPFQVEDFRAYLTQNVVNLAALRSYLASKHNFAAAKLTAEDARGLVILTVGNAYLLCIADQARIDAINAELKTSQLSLSQAQEQHAAGTVPRLDVLRAQVDVQNEQQNLISTTNTLAKDKIALARTIGLPLDQPFRLSDALPFKALDAVDPDQAFADALKQRKDLAAAEEQLKSAELQKKAAVADQYPTVSISGDFGDLGETVGHSHGTYSATGVVQAPILQIARTRGEEQVADAAVTEARASLSDKIQQVNADIRDAELDIQSAAKLVEATQSNLGLAREALDEAQQRFHAGISDNLPVSQAQSQFEQANDQFISALYQHNLAKLSLARALGVADPSYKDYLGGK